MHKLACVIIFQIKQHGEHLLYYKLLKEGGFYVIRDHSVACNCPKIKINLKALISKRYTYNDIRMIYTNPLQPDGNIYQNVNLNGSLNFTTACISKAWMKKNGATEILLIYLFSEGSHNLYE